MTQLHQREDPGWDLPTDPQPELAADAAEAAAAHMQDDIRHNEEISKEANRIRIREAAIARVRAEKVATTNYADLFLDRAQLLELPTAEPLIEKVLPRHAYAVLRGRDHSFKSFVAIDWACCLATGKPWQTHPVEQTRVLYIAGEGAHGLSRRVEAWEYAWGVNVPPDMLTVRRAALDLHNPGPAYDHLLTHVDAGGYGLVIVDTLRRVSGAAAENSSEMGLVTDNLDRLKQATAAGTVLAVAHTDKGDHDARGHSSIEDDADVVWAAKRDDMFLTLELTKMKDGPDGHTLDLEATRVLASLVLGDNGGKPEASTTESEAKILDALDLLPENGATGPNLMSLAGLTKPTFYRALKALQTAGHVTNTGTKKSPFYELPTLLTDPEPTNDQESQ